MYYLYIISVFFHILFVILWLGSSLFVSLIFFPSIKDNRQQGLSVLKDLAPAWKRYVWLSFAGLLITGLINAFYRFGFEAMISTTFWQSRLGLIFVLKLLLVLIVTVNSFYHDLILGPKVSTMDQSQKEAIALRKKARLLGRAGLIAGAIIVSLAIMMIR